MLSYAPKREYAAADIRHSKIAALILIPIFVSFGDDFVYEHYFSLKGKYTY
jgi:hypothetical protein